MRVLYALCLVVLQTITVAGVAAKAADEDAAPEVRYRFIEGSGGAPLALMEWGATEGPSILFLHGAGFTAEFWLPQTASPSVAHYKMAAIDLRGHGASAKPWRAEELVDTRIWAEDVAAAIAAADLRKPVIVGWSYGGFVAMDYVRHFGTGDISGIVLIASTAGLTPRLHPGGDDLPGGPEAYAEAARQRSSASVFENHAGNDYFARLMTATELPAQVLERWTLGMMTLPAYVTHALSQGGRSLENGDLAAKLQLPVAIAVGSLDRSMPFAALEATASELPQGEYWLFQNAGHALSTERAADFNTRLADFVQRVTEWAE